MSASGAAPSWRERSKARRRVAIQRAALRLFAERGFENTTIADIAEAAEVSPRTVLLYFPSKLGIALSTSNDTAHRLTETFRAHPDESFTEVVDRWLRAEETSSDPELVAMARTMFDAKPKLRAAALATKSESAQHFDAALLAETGLPADDPMTGVVDAAVRAALAHYTAMRVRDPEVRQAFVRYLRTVISAAGSRAKPR